MMAASAFRATLQEKICLRLFSDKSGGASRMGSALMLDYVRVWRDSVSLDTVTKAITSLSTELPEKLYTLVGSKASQEDKAIALSKEIKTIYEPQFSERTLWRFDRTTDRAPKLRVYSVSKTGAVTHVDTDLDTTSPTVKQTMKSTAGAQKGVSSPKSSVRSSTAYVREIISKYRGTADQPIVVSNATRLEKINSRQPKFGKDILKARCEGLVKSVKTAKSVESRTHRLEQLTVHLLKHPECRDFIVQKLNGVSCLLRLLKRSEDKQLIAQAYQTLSLLGYVPPVRGRGLKIMSIDGGGVKGLAAIQTLKQLEAACGRPLYEMFDYVSGVSTGAMLAVLVFVIRVKLDEVEQLYKAFSAKMFERNRLFGSGKLFWKHAYYDSTLWEEILRENFGLDGQAISLLQTARDPGCPKLSIVSTRVNTPTVNNYLFRNYALPAGASSRYAGSCSALVWQAIRASSAAPGYYEEFALGDVVHQDGGLLSNNPTAIALHECKHLWPNERLQCILSIGNGRYEPYLSSSYTALAGEDLRGSEGGQEGSAGSSGAGGSTPQGTGLKDKLTKLVQSAADTEAVHTVLSDTLPPRVYYRFNPYLSSPVQLDETRADLLDQLELDAQMYLRRNAHRLKAAANTLTLDKRPHQRLADFLKLKLYGG